jgi:hypothetical protein
VSVFERCEVGQRRLALPHSRRRLHSSRSWEWRSLQQWTCLSSSPGRTRTAFGETAARAEEANIVISRRNLYPQASPLPMASGWPITRSAEQLLEQCESNAAGSGSTDRLIHAGHRTFNGHTLPERTRNQLGWLQDCLEQYAVGLQLSGEIILWMPILAKTARFIRA